MNIKILDNWLKEYLQTDATPKQIAERLSLTSVGIERIEKWKNDFLYDIEVTTNRPDLASVVGIAREAGAVLPQSGLNATFTPQKLIKPHVSLKKESIKIEFDPKLVNRICAVVLEVEVKASPEKIANRLEASSIRSLNNIIDVTNYVMRTIGHPTHVFDFDKLPTKHLLIRESKKGEKITTLDKKTYTLPGGDIVADDGKGTIVDLLAIMGLENSVVGKDTKRILFFVNNNEVTRIRRTSMTLGIRTEAAQLNEKGIDPESAMDALLYGIQLYQEIAKGKVISDIVDLYPKRSEAATISVPLKKISDVIGIDIPKSTSITILKNLGFSVESNAESLLVKAPSNRSADIGIQEDIIEEIARVYGYHKIPSLLPEIQPTTFDPYTTNEFYWEKRIKNALKFWGFTEVYTYPMVNEEMIQEKENSVKLSNPLGEEFVYFRQSLIPGLLRVVQENKRFETVKLFEVANVYLSNKKNLPHQVPHIAGILKGKSFNFYHAKGIIEQLCTDLGVADLHFSAQEEETFSVKVIVRKELLGSIIVADKGVILFELDFAMLLKHATTKKTYTPLAKFPPVIEDLTLIIPQGITTGEISIFIKKQSNLVKEVTLIDKYEDARTFHILYQDPKRNLTNEDVTKVKEKILTSLKKEYAIKSK